MMMSPPYLPSLLPCGGALPMDERARVMGLTALSASWEVYRNTVNGAPLVQTRP